MFYIIFLFSYHGFTGISSPPGQPPGYSDSRLQLYCQGPLQITVTTAALQAYSEVCRNGAFRVLFMIFALLGFVISLAFSINMGSLRPAIMCLLADLLIFFCLVPSGVTVNDELRLSCYSPVDNWQTYHSGIPFQGSPNVNVPYPFALAMQCIGAITYVTTEFADNFGSSMTGVSYRAFPYLMGDAIKTILSENPVSGEVAPEIERYVKGCLAPSIEKAYIDGGTIPPTLEEVSVQARTIQIEDPFTQEVVSCQEFMERMRQRVSEDISQMLQEIEQSAVASDPEQAEAIIKEYGASQFLTQEPVPSAASTTDVLTGMSLGKYITEAMADQVNYASHVRPEGNKFFRWATNVFGNMSEKILPIFGGLTADTLWRIFPYICSFSTALFFLGLPIIILFSLLPGGRGILFEYFRGLVWVFSWLPFTVAAVGLINSFVMINTVNRLMAVNMKGLIGLDTLQRLSVSGSIATGVGSVFIILIPIISYAVIARGSFSGLLSGFAGASTALMGAGAFGVSKITQGTSLVSSGGKELMKK